MNQGNQVTGSTLLPPSASLCPSLPISTGFPSALSFLPEAILALVALPAVKQIASLGKGPAGTQKLTGPPSLGTGGEGLFIVQEEVRLDYRKTPPTSSLWVSGTSGVMLYDMLGRPGPPQFWSSGGTG